jgi:hypothetical protein
MDIQLIIPNAGILPSFEGSIVYYTTLASSVITKKVKKKKVYPESIAAKISELSRSPKSPTLSWICPTTPMKLPQ